VCLPWHRGGEISDPRVLAMTLKISEGQPQRYLTAAEVADLLGVDKSTVHRWADADPSMPATRIGKVVRFHPDSLAKWLEGRTQRSRRSPAARGPQ
jgi:excisionase family DNA binding protein